MGGILNLIVIMDYVGLAVDALGVSIMLIGILASTVIMIGRLRNGISFKRLYTPYRHSIGRAIILGLEFLVAGDIIRTVAVRPTYQSVLVLGMIVGIRTFLSMTLTMEVEGRWPWQRGKRPIRERRTAIQENE